MGEFLHLIQLQFFCQGFYVFFHFYAQLCLQEVFRNKLDFHNLSQEFYFEDLKRTVVNFGERHTFQFFYDPKQKINYKKITEEQFFKS